jgi:hypothetical protein
LDKPAKTKLINDIENRLDDFFGEQNEAPPSSETHCSIEKLKSAVLSIDWEITDACLTDLIDQAEVLLPQFKTDPIAHALLRMLRALGRYIRKHKAQAHQDAIKRVMSVFASFEMMAENSQLEGHQKKRIVAKEIQAFKKLKEQIEAQKKQSTAAPAQGRGGVEASGIAALLEHDQFKQAMLEVEERLNSEVRSLRNQLASLQKELDALRKA